MDEDIPKTLSESYRRFLYLCLFIALIGATKPVFWNDGSNTAKYLSKLHTVEVHGDETAEQLLTSSIFGDQDKTFDQKIEKDEPLISSVDTYFTLDKIFALILLIGGLCGFFVKSSRFICSFLVLLSLYFAVEALSVYFTGGKRYSQWALFAHAARWGFPLALIALYLDPKYWKASKAIAAVCCSLTFGVHGWEALNLNPPFQDLLHRFGYLVGFSLPVNGILKVVGCMDLCLALLVLFYPRRKVLLLMIFWGCVTALSRPLCMGLGAWPEWAIRIANGFLPLLLFSMKYMPSFSLSCFKNINQPMEVPHEQNVS